MEAYRVFKFALPGDIDIKVLYAIHTSDNRESLNSLKRTQSLSIYHFNISMGEVEAPLHLTGLMLSPSYRSRPFCKCT